MTELTRVVNALLAAGEVVLAVGVGLVLALAVALTIFMGVAWALS